MIVHAGFVGVLIFSAGLGSVIAQEQPVPNHAEGSARGGPTARRRERRTRTYRPSATCSVLRQGVQREGRKGAR